MSNWVVRISLAVTLAWAVVPATAWAGRIAGDMSNLPPDLGDIGAEYIGIEVRRSTGLLKGEPGSVGPPIRPTDSSGRPFPTRNALRAAGQLDATTDLPTSPTAVPAFYDEDEGRVYFYGKHYDFTIPPTTTVDGLVGASSPAGSTRQAINLAFFRKDVDPTAKPKRTQDLSALLVEDSSSQTIDVIVPRPAALAGAVTSSGVVTVYVYVPYYVCVPVAHQAIFRHGLLGHCRR